MFLLHGYVSMCLLVGCADVIVCCCVVVVLCRRVDVLSCCCVVLLCGCVAVCVRVVALLC